MVSPKIIPSKFFFFFLSQFYKKLLLIRQKKNENLEEYYWNKIRKAIASKHIYKKND